MKTPLIPLFAIATLLTACGEDNRARPTAPSAVPPPASVYFSLYGRVTEPTDVSVRGDFSIKASDAEGVKEATVYGDSQYAVIVKEGPVTLEVVKDGYHTLVETVEVRGSALRHDVEIKPVTPPAAFTGAFWMTLSADPVTCASFNPELQTRRYAVDVGQAGAAVTLHLSDPKLMGQQVAGEIHGTALSFDLEAPDWYYGGSYSLEESLDDTRRLVIAGTVRGTVSESGATGQLSGTWTLQENLVDARGCQGLHAVRFDRR